jgi:phosphate:Na+ symporter
MDIAISIFSLIGGIGAFLIGMKLMSDGLERSAGKGMQRMLGKISNNRFVGVGIGAAVTTIIQSSSATTVMVVGFVNAGVMTLFQATSIIFGANIGTTVTAFLASLSSFNIAEYLGAFAFIGIFIVLFAKKEKVERLGQILSGIGLIFISLKLMGSAFKNPEVSGAIEGLFGSIGNNIAIYPLIFVLLSMVITGIVQSSSVVTSICLIMVASGSIPLEHALFIVIGANIGTCVTAIIASTGASINAKRAALIHFFFNVAGSVLFIAILWIFSAPILRFLELFKGFEVSVFHLIFNMLTAALALPFVKYFVKFATIILPDKGVHIAADVPKFSYIDDRLLLTPPIAIAQVRKEVKEMADAAKTNLDRGMNAIFNRDISEKGLMSVNEQKINFVNKGIAVYLIKLSSASASKSDESEIGTFHHVISDIERIGDNAVNLMDRAEEMLEKNIYFTGSAVQELKDMRDKVSTRYDEAIHIFMTGDVGRLSLVSDIENEVDLMKKTFGNNHITRLHSGECSVDSGACFYALISALERIADHLTNIAFSIKSPSGSQREAMAIIAKEEAKHKGHV